MTLDSFVLASAGSRIVAEKFHEQERKEERRFRLAQTIFHAAFLRFGRKRYAFIPV